MLWAVLGVPIAMLLAFAGLTWWQIRRRHMQRWLPAYIRERRRFQVPSPSEEIHVLLCLADHFEPKAGNVSVEAGRERVAAWVERYPRQFGHFRDSDGRPPRYTFFFPVEEYEKEYLDALAGLCQAGFGEVEMHLHHDNDTSDGFRAALLQFKETLVTQHGLLARHRQTGAVMYGFIHGNWALCNSRPDGRWCGVNDELAILRETGCYADFTFPSAPSDTQPPIINQIYYACDRPGEARSHETALPADEVTDHALLQVQGPLVLNWRRRKLGFFPAVENGCLQTTQPPSMDRLEHWLRARVQVPGRPDWFFVKLHAHGAPAPDRDMLLGEPMVTFHADLAKLARDNPKFHFHYVTAREVYNLIRAAQAGFRGPVAEARDWELTANAKAECSS